MALHEHRGARRRRGALRQQLPLEEAPPRKLVLKWREAWRAEMARRKREEKVYELPRDGVFAAAIARAEFGRHYWNGTLDRQLKLAKRNSNPKRK